MAAIAKMLLELPSLMSRPALDEFLRSFGEVSHDR
jgi:hypothetical protein